MNKKLITLREVFLTLAKIYDEASQLETIEKTKDFIVVGVKQSLFMCNSLNRGKYSHVFRKAILVLDLFEPETNQYLYGGGWFTIEDQIGFAERANVLYFCAEMCKDKKFVESLEVSN